MTAVIHHGAPGSYKTFSLVQRVVIPALIAGRTVVTNIRGLNNLESIKALGHTLPDTAAILYLEPDTQGFDNMARFFHWAPAGALIAMDEGQRVYPTRMKSFDALDQADDIPILDAQGQPVLNSETQQPITRPATLEIAFDQHRHFNWDIYISTPNIGKIHAEIRKVVEWAYRHRNNSGLLPWYKNTWTEFRHDAEQNGKSLSHYSGAPKRYKADHRVFTAYQSTATGKAKNSTENISIFRDPKLRMLFGLIALCVGYVAYNISAAFDRYHDNINKKNLTVNPLSVQAPAENLIQNSGVSHHNPAALHPAPRVPASVGHVAAQPFVNDTLYFTGQIDQGRYLFEVHHLDGSVTHLDLRDVNRLGFTLTTQSKNFLALEYAGQRLLVYHKPHQPTRQQLAERNYQESLNLGATLSTSPAITNVF